MTIDSIRVSLMNYQRVVILKEKESDRYLPIWIGPAEADAIAVKLQDVSVPRPLTHDLLGNVIGALGGSVNSITISNLENDTFFAEIRVQVDGKDLTIDSRPSDALALAVRSDVPIFVDESVLSRAAIFLDKETGKPIPASSEEGEAPRELDEAELKRMSAFTDFIDSLDLSDLGDVEGGKEEKEDEKKDKEGDAEGS